MMRSPPGATLAIACTLSAASAAAAQSTFPPDTAVQRLIEERVSDGRTAGIVIGLIDADGRTRVQTAGTAGGGVALNDRTIFEIGSITKVFAGVLLADMALRGEVALDDPVSKFLPAQVTVPARNGRQITLAHLSTQTSGLPRLPANLRPGDPLNPYADYTVEQLYDFLNGYTLTRDPGAQFEYSNLGVGLLGHVLALRAGTSFEELVRERILQPLGMTSTTITLTPGLQERVAQGHNASGSPVPLWDLPTLAAAGALRSDMRDMLIFARAALGGTGAVHEAIRFAIQPRESAGTSRIGLGWIHLTAGTDTIVWHNGGTGGFRTFLGVVPARGRAVVVLTNTGGQGSDDLALHLLDPALPLAAPPRRAIDVPVAVLQRYVGTYELAPNFAIVVTLDGAALHATPTGQATVRLWPESETRFFLREVDAQISFQIDEDGSVTGLVLHQGGRNTPGRRR